MGSEGRAVLVGLLAIGLLLGFIGTAHAAGGHHGLVAAYGFDEGSGGTVADSSGEGNDGTITGAAWEPGKFGDALHFDGSTGFVEIPDDDSLDLTDSMTVSAWVKLDDVHGRWQQIVYKAHGSGGSFAFDADRPSGSEPNFAINDGSWYGMDGPSPLPENEWVHLAATWDGGLMELYVDGEPVAYTFVDTTLPVSNGSLWIGGNDASGNEHLDGLIDEVRIYDSQLSQLEIQADMASSVADQTAVDGFTGTNGLVAAYGFDASAGVGVADSSGEENDGVASGAAWTEGRHGNALSFDGTDDYVEVPDSSSLDITGDLTLSSWVKVDEIDTGRWQSILFKERGSNGSYSLDAETSSDPLATFGINDGAWTRAYASASVDEDEWAHIAGVWNGDWLLLYVNGDLVDAVAGSGILSSDGPLRIGGTDVFGGNRHLDGLIDEVRVYNRPLSQHEVHTDMETSVFDQTAVEPSNDSPPVISGAPTDGEELTTTSGTWSGTGPLDYAYQWRRCDDEGENCTDISGATSETFELTPAEVDHTVRVAVTAEGPGGEQEVVSEATDVVSGFTAGIEGTARRTEELRAVAGTWRGSESVSFDYQWHRCDGSGEDCDDIDGARRRTYSLTTGDLGHTIRVTIAAGPGTASTRSAATAVVVERLASRAVDPPVYGHAAVGETVGTASGGWNPDSATVSYQWRRCDAEGGDCAPIVGATARTYAVQTADIDATLRVAVTATTSGGAVTKTSRPTLPVVELAVSNTVAPAVAIEAGASGSSVVADTGEWDADGDVSYAYRWQRCSSSGEDCVEVGGETADSYPLTDDDIDSRLRLVVTARASSGKGTAVSSPTSTITATAPTNVEAPAVTGTARAGDDLVADVGRWTAVGRVEHEFQWQRCDATGDNCAAIAGATDAIYEAVAEDVAGTLRVRVTATNSTDDASAFSTVTGVVAPAGVGPTLVTPPSISGTPESGSTLTALSGTWSDAVAYGYYWERCDETGQECDPIGSDSSATRDLTDADVGSVLRVEVVAFDAEGVSAYAGVATTQTIRVPGGPANSVRPAITGDAEEGETLTATAGTWATIPPASYQYRWQACDDGVCADIEGETTSSLTLTHAHALRTVRVVVTAEDEAGATTAVSDTTVVVSAVSPVNLDRPAVTGDARVDETLTTDSGTWDGAPTIAHAYQWRRCDATGGACEDIAGADDPTYELVAGDANHAVRAEVTATNGAGSREMVSRASLPVADADGPQVTVVPEIEGVAFLEEELTVTDGEWSPEPDSHTYRWQRCDADGDDCADIDGATGGSYVVTHEDVDSALRAVVTATEAGDDAHAVTDLTEMVGPEGDEGPADILVGTDPPTIAGDIQENGLLTADPGTWQSESTVTYQYRWQRCNAHGRSCADIDGVDGQDYRLEAADLDATVRVVVVATNDWGSAAMVSELTEVVEPGGPVNVELPSFEGDAMDGELLAGYEGEWIGSDVNFDYQWRRCDEEGEDCVDIAEATDWEYWLTSDDVGATVRLKVTATNGVSSSSATSAASAVIAAGAPVNDGQPNVSGSALQDATLEADPGWWLGTPELSFGYQWRRCDEEGEDCADIGGATAATYDLTSADVGATVRVKVTATNTAGASDATSDPTDIVGPPSPPVLDTPSPELSGQPYLGRTFSADPGGWTGLEPIDFTYEWRRCDATGDNCAAIGGATGATYVAQSADLAGTLRVEVTATNASGSDSAVSDPSAVIATAAVANVDPPTISGDAEPGAELTADPGVWSGSGPMTYAYQWRSCDDQGDNCTDITGADESAFTVRIADGRRTVRVTVTATGALGDDDATSEPLAIAPAPSVNTSPPTISGTLVVGQALTASNGSWDPEPDQYLRQWQRCSITGTSCANISGQTASSYTLTSTDAGKTIRLRITAKNDGDTNPPLAFSAISDVVNTVLPSNLTLPTLSTTEPVVGEEVTAANGTWIGAPTLSYSYQWQYCSAFTSSCSDIFGETGQSYTPTSLYKDWRLRVWVTATNSNGSVSEVSDRSDPVGDGPPTNLSPPTLLGDPVVGGSVEVDSGSWSGASIFDVAWQRCDAEGEECEPIPTSAESWTYVPTTADLGHTLRAIVTGYSSQGQTSEATEPSELVAAPTRPVNDVVPSIDGTAEIGESLLAVEGEWSGSPTIDFHYRWLRCNADGHACASVDGDSSYEPRRADVGSKIRLQVTATNGWGSVTATSDATNVVPAALPLANVLPPTLPSAFTPLFYGLDYEAESAGVWAGDPEVTSQWQRCDPLTEDEITGEMDCADIPGATDPDDYVPTGDDVGFKLRLAETATVPGDSETAYSDPSDETVAFEFDDDGGFYSGPPVVGETIVADSTVQTDAGLPTTTTYEFLRRYPNGSTDPLQDGPSPEYEITAGEFGYEIRIVMTVSIWRADEEIVLDTDEVTITTPEVEDQPANDVLPTIEGDTVAGASLHAEPGDWSGGGGPLDYAYAWQRCDDQGEDCVPIVGATEQDYELGVGDVGATLRVEVVASNGPADGAATSEATGLIATAEEPANIEPPTITGDTLEFSTVVADPGSWSGSDPVEYSFQWQSCAADEPTDCSGIADGTEAEYELTDVEVGEQVRVKVTATNAAGSATAVSEPVGPVEPAGAPLLEDMPNVSVLGPPESGSTLVTDGGAWQNADADALDYRWQRCGALGFGCEDVEDAEEHSYELTDDDIGSRLRVVVTASNSGGEMTATTALSPLIGASTGSADGKMAYLNEDRNKLYLSDTDGSNPELIGDCQSLTGDEDCGLRRPRISPNLKLIAVEERSGGGLERGEGTILLLNFDGSDSRELATGSDPAWTEDGTELLLTAVDPGDSEIRRIVRVDAAGGVEPVVVVAGEGSWEAPDVSPDGDIVYAGQGAQDDTSGIYIAGPEGDDGQLDIAQATRLDLEPHIADAYEPRFSSDGDEIYFTAATAETGAEGLGALRGVWAIDTDGKGLRRITPDENSAHGPPTPAGDRILVSRRTATIVYLSGSGNAIAIMYDSSAIWEIKPGDSEPVPVADEAVDPEIARIRRPGLDDEGDYIDCPRSARCGKWGRDERRRAREYALRWADGRNPRYRAYPNDCTNFVSQVWAAAGHKKMREYERGEWSWWTRHRVGSESWVLVEKFVEQQRDESRRAEGMGGLAPSRWKVGDVIVYNWNNGGPSQDHLSVVTKGGPRPRISHHSTNRRNVLWADMVDIIRDAGYRGWTYSVLRPRYKAANIPKRLR